MLATHHVAGVALVVTVTLPADLCLNALAYCQLTRPLTDLCQISSTEAVRHLGQVVYVHVLNTAATASAEGTIYWQTKPQTQQQPSCRQGKPTVLVDIYSSYTACRHMNATTFSGLFTYPTPTRGKM